MIKFRSEADETYQLLSKSEEKALSVFQKDSYTAKLLKLIDALKEDIKDNYYIQSNDVEFGDIFEFKNINYIYELLKSSDTYSNAKEV